MNIYFSHIDIESFYLILMFYIWYIWKARIVLQVISGVWVTVKVIRHIAGAGTKPLRYTYLVFNFHTYYNNYNIIKV